MKKAVITMIVGAMVCSLALAQGGAHKAKSTKATHAKHVATAKMGAKTKKAMAKKATAHKVMKKVAKKGAKATMATKRKASKK